MDPRVAAELARRADRACADEPSGVEESVESMLDRSAAAVERAMS